MRIVKNVATRDSPLRLRPRPLLRDERLDAISPGHVLDAGEVWDGTRRYRDVVNATVGSLAAPGLSLGGTLSAEQSPVVAGLLGTAWDGVAVIRSTLAGAKDETFMPVIQSSANLQEALEGGDPTAVRDSYSAWKRDCEAVDARLRSRRSATNDGQKFLAKARDAARAGIAALNAAAARRWAPERTHDSATTEVRDQLDAANRATNLADKIRAMNSANSAFHTERTRDNYEALLTGPAPGTRRALESHIRSGTSGARTPAEINEANRRFWASRS
jgi:hypothetical protein